MKNDKKKKKTIIIVIAVILVLRWCWGDNPDDKTKKKNEDQIEKTTTEKTTTEKATTESKPVATTETTTEETTEEIGEELIEEEEKEYSVIEIKIRLINEKAEAINSLSDNYSDYVSNYKNLTAWYELADSQAEELYKCWEQKSINYYSSMVEEWNYSDYNSEWETDMTQFAEERNKKLTELYEYIDGAMQEIYASMDEHLTMGLDAGYAGVDERIAENTAEYAKAYDTMQKKYAYYMTKLASEDAYILQGLKEGNRDVVALAKVVQDQMPETMLTAEEDEIETEPTTETSAASEQSSGVTPSFKSAMDQYESFFNEYVRFIKNYDPMDVNAATKYMNLMTKYESTMNAINNINTANLSSADYAYYLEVMGRINAKLASLAY